MVSKTGNPKVSDEPLVSVVTPVHNTEEYVAECIESVLAQTYQNYEFLIVNNASTDRSGEIIAEFAGKDRRIRVIETGKLLSQLENFNFALGQCSPGAKYVKMVQADDWIFAGCLTEMVALAEAYPNIGMVSSYRFREASVQGLGLHPTRSVASGHEICRKHLIDRVFMFGSPTTVLYRADIVRDRKPFFKEGRLHADTEASYEIVLNSDFGFVHQLLSFSRMQEASISGAVKDFAPDELDRLISVKLYAHLYLTREECETTTTGAVAEYYDALARGALLGAGSEFWNYHRDGLGTIGETIDQARVAKHVVRVLAHMALSPLNLVRKFRRRNRVGAEGKRAEDWLWAR
jgi:glycosyltransferase involved in cell wall biosynthesis